MNPLALKGIASLLAFAFILLLVRHLINVHDQGIRDAQDAIWMKRENAVTAKVEADVAEKNKIISALQLQIDDTSKQLAAKEKELNDEQNHSESLQSDLITAHQRMYARGTISAGIAAQQAPSTESPTVGNRTEVEFQLDPAIAASLAKLAGEGDSSIIRLNACIAAYQSVQQAVNGQ